MNFVERKAAEYRQGKRQQWEEIQEKAPELARFMTELAKVFGKVKLIEVNYENADKNS